MLRVAFRESNTDGDPDFAFVLTLADGLCALARAYPAETHAARLDFPEQRFERSARAFHLASFEHDCKLLAAVSEGVASAATSQLSSDHFEYAVAGLMAITIIEPFEVIDIDHSDADSSRTPREALIERAPIRQAR